MVAMGSIVIMGVSLLFQCFVFVSLCSFLTIHENLIVTYNHCKDIIKIIIVLRIGNYDINIVATTTVTTSLRIVTVL